MQRMHTYIYVDVQECAFSLVDDVHMFFFVDI